MTPVPAGEFLMGSEDGEADERPVHPVQLDGFLIGVQPVTNAEYARFVRETSFAQGPGSFGYPAAAVQPPAQGTSGHVFVLDRVQGCLSDLTAPMLLKGVAA